MTMQFSLRIQVFTLFLFILGIFIFMRYRGFDVNNSYSFNGQQEARISKMLVLINTGGHNYSIYNNDGISMIKGNVNYVARSRRDANILLVQYLNGRASRSNQTVRAVAINIESGDVSANSSFNPDDYYSVITADNYFKSLSRGQ
jgi:hypothetical protein